MKRFHILHYVLATIVILTTSCSQDNALFEDENLQTYTLYLDADVPSFDAVREGETRASGNSWADGDVIYIVFSNGGSQVVVAATYYANSGNFQFSTSSTLNAVSDAPCPVYYFRGGSYTVSGTTVTMDKHTAIFSDTNAKYSYSNNTVVMRAAFKPYTWRLCFKGSIGTQVNLNSSSTILYNTSLNMNTGNYSSNTGSEILQVKSDGYTPYVYGLFSGTSNSVRIEVGGVNYSRTISSSKLNVGESGYFTIPTSSNLYGWTKSDDGNESEINRNPYGDDKNLDNTTGGSVDNTGNNDINKGDYGSDQNLDGTTGGGVDNTGSNDINKGSYGEDKNLD